MIRGAPLGTVFYESQEVLDREKLAWMKKKSLSTCIMKGNNIAGNADQKERCRRHVDQWLETNRVQGTAAPEDGDIMVSADGTRTTIMMPENPGEQVMSEAQYDEELQRMQKDLEQRIMELNSTIDMDTKDFVERIEELEKDRELLKKALARCKRNQGGWTRRIWNILFGENADVVDVPPDV